jgi:hypothetical protein
MSNALSLSIERNCNRGRCLGLNAAVVPRGPTRRSKGRYAMKPRSAPELGR